ncbi:MAG: peptidoglycan-binding protein, partial [Clostridia bacterium]|nr:peptidoglycan-binding protein [Clostridia bacterium]
MKKRALCVFLCMAAVLCLCLTAQAAYAKLQRGDASNEVYRMQTALASLGYSITCDGKYGAATERTVRQFQKDQGLSQDGVAGNLTLTRLYQLAPGAAAIPQITVTQVPYQQPTGSASTYQKLKFGDSGAAVLQLQSALNSVGFALKADGVYGAA